MESGGDPWYDEQPWHHRPIPMGLVNAAAMFCFGFVLLANVAGAAALAVLGGLAGYFAWCPNGYGWKIEAQKRDRIDAGEPEVRSSFLIRGGLVAIGVIVGLLALSAAFG